MLAVLMTVMSAATFVGASSDPTGYGSTERIYSLAFACIVIIVTAPFVAAFVPLYRRAQSQTAKLIVIYAAIYCPCLAWVGVGYLNYALDHSPGVPTRYVFDERVERSRNPSYNKMHLEAEPSTTAEFYATAYPGRERRAGDVIVLEQHPGAFGIAWIRTPGVWATPPHE